MIIAITAKGADLNAELDLRFGRAQNYIIYDTELKTFATVSNQNIEAAGGAGTAAAQLMAKEGVAAVISGDFGPNASTALKALNIKMFTSNSGVVQDIIEQYTKGALPEIDHATVKGHHS